VRPYIGAVAHEVRPYIGVVIGQGRGAPRVRPLCFVLTGDRR